MHRSAVSSKLCETSLPPEELLRYCRQTLPEDTRGFELLVAQYKGFVFRTAYRLTGNREDADDLAQEVFLKIYRGINRIDNPQTLSTWIYRITVNTCLDKLRKEKRNRVQFSGIPQDNPEDETGEREIRDARSLTPEDTVVQSEMVQCLEDTLARLESTNRAILVLREIEERSYEEIAQVLELGLSAVKMRIHRARLLFKQLLDQICPDLYEHASKRIYRNQSG